MDTTHHNDGSEANGSPAPGNGAARGAADNAIIVHDLKKRFGRQRVLDGVNLDVPNGMITCIVGPSGGGKTVLLKHLNLLMRPNSGTITIDGVDVTRLGTRALNQ